MRSIAKRPGLFNRLGVGLLMLMAAWLSAGRAGAHPEFSPVETNRYVKFDLTSEREVRLAYTVLFGALPAAAARREADRDSNGRIDADEAKALGERVRERVRAGVDLTVDGRKLAPGFEPPVVGMAGPEVGPSPFSVDLVAMVRLSGNAPHLVRFDDGTEFERPGETEIRIEEGPGTRLLAAYRGAPGGPIETRFLFRGPKFSALEDRSISFSFGAVAAARASRRLPPLYALAALLAAGLAALIWKWRSRRA